MSFATIAWQEDGVVMLDQTRLPAAEVYLTCRDYDDVARAIKTMVIRGAPAIGVAAAMGVALGMQNRLQAGQPLDEAGFAQVCRTLAATRPTAVNLFWALEKMRRKWEAARAAGAAGEEIVRRLVELALAIQREDVETNERLGAHGAGVVPAAASILTHCNAGALACAGYGTALGVVRAAHAAGKVKMVFADETRPLLQGARLTAWELQRDNIPVTVITDNMAAYIMGRGEIDLVVVGADRVAANGDTANKIGTYGVALLARAHGVPFYVAAPLSTVDFSLATGAEIPIEERAPAEVTGLAGQPTVPAGVPVRNPAFDVTPA
ncbi:MAG: S-methyl-5-thioribose-1-phosphate isomerase, partial [Deltaproteobacteria bacterium]|nr:S-methyl-5-thioribose-1-phosphate isomerase [Deltaproteobacteria bacterium]